MIRLCITTNNHHTMTLSIRMCLHTSIHIYNLS